MLLRCLEEMGLNYSLSGEGRGGKGLSRTCGGRGEVA